MAVGRTGDVVRDVERRVIEDARYEDVGSVLFWRPLSEKNYRSIN